MSDTVKLTAPQEATLVQMSRLSEPMTSWRVGHAMNRAGETANRHMNALAARGLVEIGAMRNIRGERLWWITSPGRAYLSKLKTEDA